MIQATITGGLVTLEKFDEAGRRYFNVHSDEAHKTVRLIVKNDQHAALLSQLDKHSRITATGRLMSRAAVGSSGLVSALLTIDLNQLKIHKGAAND